jgi:hypothetical protein
VNDSQGWDSALARANPTLSVHPSSWDSALARANPTLSIPAGGSPRECRSQ